MLAGWDRNKMTHLQPESNTVSCGRGCGGCGGGRGGRGGRGQHPQRASVPTLNGITDEGLSS